MTSDALYDPSIEPLVNLAIERQGLGNRDAFSVGQDSVAETINRLGYLQIDTISVVSRAHQHTLWNRITDYETQMLDAAIAERAVFEYWAHAAAYLPMRDYRFAQVRMRNMREGKSRWIRSTDTRLMRKVLKRIKNEGPLRSRDFESKKKVTRGWWDWKPTKHALEQLFMQGDLMIESRSGFQKRYDLRERVLPDDVDTRFPSTQEYAAYLIETQLRSYGASPEASFTYQLTGRDLRAAVNDALIERARNGELEKRKVNGATWFVDSERLTQFEKTSKSTTTGKRTGAKGSRASDRVCLLSPFDNLVIQRDRLRALFGFDYILECYVPEGKRKFGYFALPMLHDNRFIGRMDCKAHRKTRVFEVKQLFWEPEVDPDTVITQVAEELLSFAEFNGCRKVQIDPVIKRGKGGQAVGALSTVLAEISGQSD